MPVATHPITRSSARRPSSPSSTSPMSIFFLHARFPFRLAWLCCDGAPTEDCVGFLGLEVEPDTFIVFVAVFLVDDLEPSIADRVEVKSISPPDAAIERLDQPRCQNFVGLS